jgi:hypothetical protein
MKPALVAVTLGVLALAACGGSSDSGAGAAMKALFGYIEKADWAARYESMHPEQRKLIDKQLFIGCSKDGREAHVVIGAVNIVKQEAEKDTPIPGTALKADSTVVTYEIMVNGNHYKENGHEFLVGERWYWVTSDDAMKALTAGKCP